MKKLISFMIVGLVFSVWQTSAQQEVVLKGKELFGSINARQIGPALMSGRITDLEAHPTNNRILYAGTAGGGVWKSNDGGATFNPIFDDYCQSIGAVALDPKNPDQIVWVGTGETWTRNSVSVGDGLYKSVDGGSNWIKIGFENSDRISSIQINPENTDEMYVGVLGALWGDSEERGVYKSNDGGKNWDKILYADQTTGCSDLVMDPKDPKTLYASFWEFRRTAWSFNSGGLNSALYKSTDSGKTWNKIHNGFPNGKLGRIAVAVAPSDTDIVYTVIEAEKKEESGLYRSDDGGANWTLLNSDFELVVRPFYFSRITVDPRNPDVIVKGGFNGSISRDGGKTFKTLGPMHPDIHDIIFDIKDSDRMYAATDGGIYRSWNGGTTMEIVHNLPVSQFYQISVDNAEPYNIYGGLQDNGSWWGPSSSPGGIEARDWKRIGVGDGFRVLKHPTKNIIYSEMQGAQNVWRIDVDRNRNKTVQPLAVEGDPKLRFNWNAPMATSEHQPDRFYMGSQFLHKSEDMGESWVKISPDLTTNNPSKQNQEDSGGLSRDNSGAENHCTIFTIAESTLDENVIWVGTDDGNVQITQDGGKSWVNTVENIEGLPKNTWCYHIEASTHNKGTAYAVFDGHTSNDKNTYVYKTKDFGQSWKSIATDDIYGFARNIQEDYENEDLLFLGTEFGLYITVNGGKNWSKFTNNMPSTAVHFIELQKQTNDLVIGTHGRGVIIIDDISPLRQINQEVLNKDVHFFKTAAVSMPEENGFGGGSTELEFVGQNKSQSAKIIYYLKKRPIFGKMTMEIQDQNGKTITTIVPTKQKGINIVNWNFLSKAPKTASGKTIVASSGPRVAAGNYKAILTKGKKTYETTIEVNYDKNSLITAENRKTQEETVKKLFKMTEDLAYLVYEIDELSTVATKIAEENSSGKKIAAPLLKDLTTLKETLVVTTGDQYVDSAEPQLREKLAILYGKISSNFDKPSITEMQNLQRLETLFEEAKSKLGTIKDKRLKKLEKYLEKSELGSINLKSPEEFLKG